MLLKITRVRLNKMSFVSGTYGERFACGPIKSAAS